MYVCMFHWLNNSRYVDRSTPNRLGRLPAANSVDDSAAVFKVAQDLLSSKEVDIEGLTADEAFIKQWVQTI